MGYSCRGKPAYQIGTSVAFYSHIKSSDWTETDLETHRVQMWPAGGRAAL